MRARRSQVVVWMMSSLVLMAWPVGVRGDQEPNMPQAGPSPKAVEAMRLLESDDRYQREVGFLRLEALREPATLETITRYLNNRDPETRAYSVRAVAAIKGGASIPTLLEVLRTDKHPTVRRAALLGLEPFQQADPAILPAFLGALRDKKSEVRITAVDIVSRINDPRAKDAIRERAKHEHHPDVRRAVVLAVKRIGDK